MVKRDLLREREREIMRKRERESLTREMGRTSKARMWQGYQRQP